MISNIRVEPLVERVSQPKLITIMKEITANEDVD